MQILDIFLAAAVAASSPAAPTTKVLTAKDVASIDATLDRREFRRAGLELQTLVNQRMQLFGGPREEFEITRLLGKGTEFQGDHASATTILKFAAEEAPTPADRLRVLPDLAAALEGSGALAQAKRVYAEIIQADGPSASEARLALARVALIETPRDVHQLVQPLLNSDMLIDVRWEATLIDARASGLLGNTEGQRASLQAAWALAPAVTQRHGAIQRTAIDLALANGGSAMSLFGLSLTDQPPPKGLGQLRSQLPACGRYGITENDWVVISIWRGPGTSNHANLEVISASRPAVVAPFLLHLKLPSQLSAYDFPLAVTPIRLRCRTGVSPDYVATAKGDGAVGVWFLKNGLYPPYLDTSDDEGGAIAALQEELSNRSSRFGSSSITLLPVISSLVEGYRGTPGNESQDNFRRMVALYQQQLAIAEQAKAPPAYLAALKMWITISQLWLGENDPALAFGQMQSNIDIFLQDGNLADDAVQIAKQLLVENAPGSTAQKLDLAEHIAKSLAAKGKADDPALEALRLKIALFRRDTLGTSVNNPSRICGLADQEPKRLSGDITSEDYPAEAISAAITGLTALEADIGTDGTAVNLRPVISSPPGLFDALTAEKLSGFRFSPAKIKGSPTKCVGYFQQVRWQIPQ